MVSVIIPSRSPQLYLQRTIDDLVEKARGEVEVIVVLDGVNANVGATRIIRHPEHKGMRAGINAGMEAASGEYVMKIDEHCMMDEGWDEKLIADCEDDWLVVPRRQRLDPDAWLLTSETEGDRRPPVDYMSIAYPYERPYDRTCGLYGGVIDHRRTRERSDILIDETMSMQGSCYFCKKDYWFSLLHPMEDSKYGAFNHEAQELHFKAQLSGGKLMVNKKTWYAHAHKGAKGKQYGFSRAMYRQHELDKEKARRYALDYWLTTKDYKYDFEWLIDHFWPVPGWPENWKERIAEDAKHDWRHDPSKQPSQWLDVSKL